MSTSSTNFMPGVSTLGHTFNAITSDYAIQDDLNPLIAIDGILNSSNCQTQTNNADAQQYEVPQGVQYLAVQSSMKGTTAQGKSKSSYALELAVNASIDARYGMYQGSVDASYGKEVTATNQTYYLTTFDTWSYYNLGLSLTDVDTATTDLKATNKNFCVSAQMQDAFAGLEVDTSGRNAYDFFISYGTHVLMGIVMGGQCRYSAYGSEEDFESEQNFNVNAEAKYSSLTKSAAFSTDIAGTSTSKQSAIQSQTSVTVFGGSPDSIAGLQDNPSSADYTAWSSSICDTLALIDYQAGGVCPVWQLCIDAQKSAYLKSVFGQLYNSTGYTFESYGQHGRNCINGIETWNSDPDNSKSWVSGNESEAMVGFGGNINSDKHIGKLIIITYDFVSGNYITYYAGDGDADTKWEAFYMAPTGCTITGIGMSQSGKAFSSLYVWYQQFQFADQTGLYLDSEVSTWQGSTGPATKVNLGDLQAGSGWCQTGTSDVDQLQRYYQPKQGNQEFLNGIKINCSNKVNGFNYLEIYQAQLQISSAVVG